MDTKSKFPRLNLGGFENTNCSYCGIKKDCIKFPCNHLCCDYCFYVYHRDKISNLQKIIESNPSVLNGNASAIGCPQVCNESLLTLSPDWLKNLFQEFNDPRASLIDLCEGFLSGIPTYFVKCFCGDVHSGPTDKIVCPRSNTDNI
jgi:hypothetical protein